MSSAPTTPLRQRMIEDMSIRQFGERTQQGYVAVVADFARFLGRSPDQAQPEDLRRYQLHLAAQGASPAKMNAAVSALRFFFKVTLGRPGYGERLATVRKEDRLPEVLSPEGVALLLHCAPSLKHKAALSVAYGCGLRVSEITHLKVSDIDSARMLIRVEQGKGRKDRYVMLAPDLLELLRRWWRSARPIGAAGPQEAGYDGPLHPRGDQDLGRGEESAVTASAAAGLSQSSCPGHPWRWPKSSAPMARPIAAPRPDI
jgi:site-specific recombinase XerD